MHVQGEEAELKVLLLEVPTIILILKAYFVGNMKWSSSLNFRTVHFRYFFSFAWRFCLRGWLKKSSKYGK